MGRKTLKVYPQKDASAMSHSKPLNANVEGSAVVLALPLMHVILFSELGRNGSTTNRDSIECVIGGGTLRIKALYFEYFRSVIIPTLHRVALAGYIELGPTHAQVRHTDFLKAQGLIPAHVKLLESHLPTFNLTSRGNFEPFRAIELAPGALGHLQRYPRSRNTMCFRSSDKARIHPHTVVEVETSNQYSHYPLLSIASCCEPNALLGYEQVFPQVSSFSKAPTTTERTLQLSTLSFELPDLEFFLYD